AMPHRRKALAPRRTPREEFGTLVIVEPIPWRVFSEVGCFTPSPCTCVERHTRIVWTHVRDEYDHGRSSTCPARSGHPDTGAVPAHRARYTPCPALPGRQPDRRPRYGLLLGARAGVLALGCRRRDNHHRRRVRRRIQAEPHLRGGLLR